MTTDPLSRTGIPGRLHEALEAARQDQAFPGAVLLWGTAGSPPSILAVGATRTDRPGVPVTRDTVFDLASLTKPLVTAALSLLAVREGRITPDTPISRLMELPKGHFLGSQPFSRLLSHSSGLLSWAPLYRELDMQDPDTSRRLLKDAILALPADYEPATQSRYSDFGYLLAGWILEQAYGDIPLDHLFESRIKTPLSVQQAGFLPLASSSILRTASIAATEMVEDRDFPLIGIVHDEHARYLGGVSGHAGLFGSGPAVWDLALPWMGGHPLFPGDLRKQFTTRLAGLPWTLGWDTPTGASQSGHHFSEKAIGHLGYTGTSVWMEPDSRRMVILLTNRVHPSRTRNQIRKWRPILHDLVMEEGFSQTP